MLILAFLLLVWPSWAWAQMESTPGAGPNEVPVRGTSNLAWHGLHNAQPEQALVDGLTIYPPSSSGSYTLVVGGANHVIKCPLSIAVVDYAKFSITEGSNVVSFDPTCWGWTNQVAPVFTVNGYDEVFCSSRNPTPSRPAQFTCNPILNIGLPPIYSIAHFVATACASATTCVAGSVTYDTTSQVGWVAIGYCDTGGSSCAGGTTQGVTVSSVSQTSGTATSTCTRATGIAGVTDATEHTTQDAFKCIATVAGTAVYTITFSALVHVPEALVATVNGVTTTSPDDAIGKTAANTPSATAPAVTTVATTTQAGEFLVSAVFAVNGSAPTAGAGYIAVVSDNTAISALLQWGTSGASGSTQTASATAAGSGGSVISVAGLKSH